MCRINSMYNMRSGSAVCAEDRLRSYLTTDAVHVPRESSGKTRSFALVMKLNVVTLG